MEYIVSNDTIIFEPKFNKSLDLYSDILYPYKKLIFSNHDLDFKLFDYYIEKEKTKNFYEFSDYIGSQFSQTIDELFPNLTNLTHLTFGRDFSHHVNNLPPNLTYLVFGNKFNQMVLNLPIHLTHLTFGCMFSQPIDNLPSNLTHLTLSFYFSQPIDNLPPNLIYLSLGCQFSQPINSLPLTIIHLELGLSFDFPVDSLPCSVQYLEFGVNFSHPLDNLPSGIKIIKFRNESIYNRELNCLPNSVEEIVLPKIYSKCIEKIPSQLKKIICYEKYKFINWIMNFDIQIETYNDWS